jgi:hypothetical protein
VHIEKQKEKKIYGMLCQNYAQAGGLLIVHVAYVVNEIVELLRVVELIVCVADTCAW